MYINVRIDTFDHKSTRCLAVYRKLFEDIIFLFFLSFWCGELTPQVVDFRFTLYIGHI
jgi:hypothetical protein